MDWLVTVFATLVPPLGKDNISSKLNTLRAGDQLAATAKL